MEFKPDPSGIPTACREVAEKNVTADKWTIDGYPRLIYGHLTVHAQVDIPDALSESEAETIVKTTIFANGWEYGRTEEFDYDEFPTERDADAHQREHYKTSVDATAALETLSREERDVLRHQSAGGLGGTRYDVTATLGAKYTVPMQWSDYEIKQTMIALLRNHSYGVLHEWDPTPITPEQEEYADTVAQGKVTTYDRHVQTPPQLESHAEDEYIF